MSMAMRASDDHNSQWPGNTDYWDIVCNEPHPSTNWLNQC